jgi:hypothetical protein
MSRGAGDAARESLPFGCPDKLGNPPQIAFREFRQLFRVPMAIACDPQHFVRQPMNAHSNCLALTHYPCFAHRLDPLSSSLTLRRDGDEDAEVFLLRNAPSTGDAPLWNADSDPRVDAG